MCGGETIRLTELLPGYWCWLASTVLFLSGSTLKMTFFRQVGAEPQDEGSSSKQAEKACCEAAATLC
ncbi:MAG: hypothetical protein ACYC3X_16510 [Pirellulaceae bacterium]